ASAQQGFVRCNMDAAIFKEWNCYGVEMCLRDARGQFIKAQTLWRHAIP
ncbi:60S ribosomal protein L23, partial [Trifolium medium]|nr:60S ribosomal protein L23 [Trifolium medium]